MFVIYAVVTGFAAVLYGIGAFLNFTGHDIPTSQADKLGVPRSWMPRLGGCFAAGSLGLLAGFVVPPLGIAAAIGLVLFFVGALITHLRVRDYALGPWASAATVAVATLGVNLAQHGPW